MLVDFAVAIQIKLLKRTLRAFHITKPIVFEHLQHFITRDDAIAVRIRFAEEEVPEESLQSRVNTKFSCHFVDIAILECQQFSFEKQSFELFER